jgi:hypothetical protein
MFPFSALCTGRPALVSRFDTDPKSGRNIGWGWMHREADPRPDQRFSDKRRTRFKSLSISLLREITRAAIHLVR